ncbi:3'(2'),5'-bisphosphate nucleotidase CysQ family protein [Synechococcus elongatus]|uniref:3'(2'),5'-bisphosphate nucleotidase CysQ family protein n=1 Tax=Synechococcus elongatus TaxID=32046 RepID=UPI000F7D5FA6|nr:inositol monophosphatase family protein [Synechococcus elongatus]
MSPLHAIAGQPVESVLAIARQVGWEAADIALQFYTAQSEAAPKLWQEGDDPVTAADLAIHRHVLERLQTAFADQPFGYLSEESDRTALTLPLPEEWVWIIDPLDGTRDFIDRTGEFAVQIALTYQQRPVLAVVAIPAQQLLYWAVQGQGCYRETQDGTQTKLTVSDRQEDLILVASRTHRGDRFQQLLDRLSLHQQIYVGSVGVKIVAIAEQRADVYLSLSGKSAPKDWDMAAPELLLLEAGGRFSHADGSALRYNTGDISQWGCLIASNGPAHDRLCQEATALLASLD